MTSDPYRILGISRHASDDETKRAYRKLSRKYHPDANINAPNPEQMEEKFKEIQQAYQQIIDEKEHGYSSYGSSYNSHQSYGTDSVKMQAAANYINSRHYKEALNVLSEMSEQTSQWYFFSAVANAGLGNNINAKSLASQAVAMEPDNMQYRQFLQQLEYGGSWYSSMGQTYESPATSDSFCLKLCLFNLFCNCCRPC